MKSYSPVWSDLSISFLHRTYSVIRISEVPKITTVLEALSDDIFKK